MAIKLSMSARSALAQTIINEIDAGGSAGTIKIYDGYQPLSPDDPPSNQNVLSEHTLSYPCGVVSNGTIIFNPISEDSYANASGTATWARFYDSNGNAVADASITEIGGGGDLEMNTVNIVANGPVRFTSLTWVMPGA